MFSAPAKPNVSDETVAEIVALIRSGRYAPGERLPGERPLARQLGVSRTSVRAALARLVGLGLLEARPGSGTYVREPSSEIIQATLAPHIVTHTATLWQLFELREIIEGEAAARAAHRATPEQIVSLRAWAEMIEACIARHDQDGLVRADVEFHRQIVLATGNDILVNLIASIAHLLREMRYVSTSNPELLPGQRAILAAIAAHDGEAARQAMLAHLQRVRAKAEAGLAYR